MKLEDLTPDASVRGIVPESLVGIVSVNWHGSDALTVVYRSPDGHVADEILYRDDEQRLEIVEVGRPWSFDGDGALFRLVSEAHRIRLAHLFAPVLAVHTSLVEPLPHQITAVYEAMLPRQPLRFLLADDPGAGKTIMAGLYIKELIRSKKHIRSGEVEEVIALSTNMARGSDTIFTMLDDADLKYPNIKDETGSEGPLTKQRFYKYM